MADAKSADKKRTIARALNLLARLVWADVRLDAKARASLWREIGRLAMAENARENEEAGIEERSSRDL
jgi:hypothetical protein